MAWAGAGIIGRGQGKGRIARRKNGSGQNDHDAGQQHDGADGLHHGGLVHAPNVDEAEQQQRPHHHGGFHQQGVGLEKVRPEFDVKEFFQDRAHQHAQGPGVQRDAAQMGQAHGPGSGKRLPAVAGHLHQIVNAAHAGIKIAQIMIIQGDDHHGRPRRQEGQG